MLEFSNMMLLITSEALMTTQTKIIFENQHYVACVTSAGLSVQSKKKGNGKLLPINCRGFVEWMGSFETAVDASESNSLCRAIYQAGL
jgi:hypothetical protein